MKAVIITVSYGAEVVNIASFGITAEFPNQRGLALPVNLPT